MWSTNVKATLRYQAWSEISLCTSLVRSSRRGPLRSKAAVIATKCHSQRRETEGRPGGGGGQPRKVLLPCGA